MSCKIKKKINLYFIYQHNQQNHVAIFMSTDKSSFICLAGQATTKIHLILNK